MSSRFKPHFAFCLARQGEEEHGKQSECPCDEIREGEVPETGS